MSTTEDIKLLLDLQDENIEIEENVVELKEYEGKMTKFITGKLTFTPMHCACCGIENKDYIIYKNGTKTSHITLPITGIHSTYLKLKNNVSFVKHALVHLVHRLQSSIIIALFQIKQKLRH